MTNPRRRTWGFAFGASGCVQHRRSQQPTVFALAEASRSSYVPSSRPERPTIWEAVWITLLSQVPDSLMAERSAKSARDARQITIRGAREHNLKNVDVAIPRDQLVVFTGLSGSGKSSLAFDTIYAA